MTTHQWRVMALAISIVGARAVPAQEIDRKSVV